VSCCLADVHGWRPLALRGTGHRRLVLLSGLPMVRCADATGPTPWPLVSARLQISTGPVSKPREAHHCPVPMSAPGSRASILQIVVT